MPYQAQACIEEQHNVMALLSRRGQPNSTIYNFHGPHQAHRSNDYISCLLIIIHNTPTSQVLAIFVRTVVTTT